MAYKKASKSKTENKELSQLRQDIESHNIKNFYIFYGEEQYLLNECVEQIEALIIDKDFEEFNLHVYQGKDIEADEIDDVINSLPAFSERSMIVIYDFDIYKNENRRTAFEKIFNDLPDYVCLIFVYNTMEYKSSGNTKLGKLVKKKACIVNFSQQNQSDLNAWIVRQFKLYNKEISNSNAEYMTFLCGSLMTNLKNEIEKTANYSSKDVIQKQDIDAVVIPVLDAQVFQMTDAISEKNFKRSTEILSDLYLMNTEPIMILSVLGRQIRQIWSARLCIENSQGEAFFTSLWDLKSSWQSNKVVSSSKRFNLRWCRKAVVLCAEADNSMKSSGLDNEQILLDLLLKLSVL